MTDHEAEARYRANLQGEVASAGLYRALADAEADPRLKQVYGRLAAVEEAHAEFWRKQLERIGGRVGRVGLAWRSRAVARLEGRRRAIGGNALRAAVLGANDGLVSNLSLVMGVAGAAVAEKTILLTGLAGLVAGACSMAMGEWLSVNSAREMAQKQIDQESSELAQAPELEKEELVLIYQAKAREEHQAKSMAEKIFSSQDAALDTLVREELGIDPEE